MVSPSWPASRSRVCGGTAGPTGYPAGRRAGGFISTYTHGIDPGLSVAIRFRLTLASPVIQASHGRPVGYPLCRSAHPQLTRTGRTHPLPSEPVRARSEALTRGGPGGSAGRGGCRACLRFSYGPSSRPSAAGSAPATSTTLVRLDAPATSVTWWRRTPNAAATAAKAAAVARPSAARSLTRTTSAPSWLPPTPGRAEPGRTRTVMRTTPVCASFANVPGAVRPGSWPVRPGRLAGWRPATESRRCSA